MEEDAPEREKPTAEELLEAFEAHDEDAVLDLIHRGAPVDWVDEEGNSPLHWAAVFEWTHIARAIVARGAPLNRQNGKNDTALHIACLTDNVPLAEMLVRAGASLDLQNNHQMTPLHIACFDSTPYDEYRNTGNIQHLEPLAREMVARGARLDLKDHEGFTPLHTACQYGFEDLALDMVNAGAPLAVEEPEDRQTPLHMACENGLARAAMKMLEKGAPLDASDKHDYLPLHYACIDSRLEQVALQMIRKGAPIQQRNTAGDTPHANIIRNGSVRDMGSQFLDAVLLPVLLGGEHGNWSNPMPLSLQSELQDLLLLRLSPEERWRPERLIVDQADQQRFFRLHHLSESWHHPGVKMPRNLRPLLGGKSWHSLMPEDYHTLQGYHITCLTSSQDLAEESRMLHHCVGEVDYDLKCCRQQPEERSHILSIRDPEGHPISTVEIKVHEHCRMQDIRVGGGDNRGIEVLQHHGKDDGPAPEKAKWVWNQFLKALGMDRVKLATEPLGETAESIARNKKIPPLLQRIGYEPTEDRINACFDEFRMPYRRGSVGEDESGHMIYDDIRTEDGYAFQNHFIQGFAVLDKENKPTGKYALTFEALPKLKEGEHVMDVRRMDALSYLRATGMLQAARRELKKNNPALAKELKNIWAEQDAQPIKERAMPIPKHEIHAAYAARAGALGDEMRREAHEAGSFARY